MKAVRYPPDIHMRGAVTISLRWRDKHSPENDDMDRTYSPPHIHISALLDFNKI